MNLAPLTWSSALTSRRRDSTAAEAPSDLWGRNDPQLRDRLGRA